MHPPFPELRARTSQRLVTFRPLYHEFSAFTVSFLPFFFFQAEDGIRDADVTGVQTCALPILGRARSTTPSVSRWVSGSSPGSATSRPRRQAVARERMFQPELEALDRERLERRSEERRGGEEGRSRGSPDHLKKKKKYKGDTL